MKDRKEISVALAGNPNCGKSSLFNVLTGAHQKVGNFSGVTIEKHEGYMDYGEYRILFVDLPGIYSLTPYSPEELVTRRFLIDERPDVVVNVVEGPNLERNLQLTTQLMEMNVDFLVALNMIDEVEEKGISIDVKQLQRLLGCHIVPTSAKKKTGIDSLLDHIVRVYEKDIEIRKNKLTFRPEVEAWVEDIAEMLQREKELESIDSRWLAIKLLENDREVYHQVRQYPLWVKVELALQDAIRTASKLFDSDPEMLITEDRYAFIRGAVKECMRVPETRKSTITDYIDMVVLNRALGLPVFLFVVWGIFQITFTLGAPLMEMLEFFFGAFAGVVEPLLQNSMLRSIVIDGIIAGVGGVLVFLPNIVLLFIGLSFLEASGYMARAAFVIDKVMHRFGLHGKSFIPMITGFGCSIPAIMATRTLKSPTDRLATILVIPFMSCGAKLPVYVLLAGAFFPPDVAANVMYAIYLLGVVVALLTAKFLKSTVLKSDSEPFVMELPPYRWPTLYSVLFQAKLKAMMYVKKAGTLILLAVIVIWAASNFPHNAGIDRAAEAEAARIETGSGAPMEKKAALDALAYRVQSEQLRHSVAGRVGTLIEPVIRPLGFDWRIGIALVTGLAAKEVVVSTMGTIYALGQTDESSVELSAILKNDPAFSRASALSLMVFVLLYIPCVAAVGVMKKEIGQWKPVLLYSVYVLALAWVLSFITYRAALLML
ncbi:MAG: ferrous iron transport protein B [Chlorobium sp.]|jgi:ferrous iron transport protein B|uniref:ferrous iron transport protein B n=1 Tax=Chlorobium sp. TaxID=1095 RepID=UPI0025B877C8|nr:ferrous iron transport protein B [Chlorobium sp.]MCF8215582.1 ferrous iron transport protein B [Chlorobium sp.]MCF8270364.1 ferrous iron transport protein B [Chlorobium sp.]MCF8286733.1 ferrous iron transport protein B [Chlorobium sp.]MCF8290255.1 ferrous iron transport protein B [Chlorobium sp.]MCF8384414.1 ferrous iron transport protein B [Chlorobium sp.]